MTWKAIGLLLALAACVGSTAPFVQLNTIHQAYSEFEVNLIFNENRNHPILLVTISRDKAQAAVKDVLESTFKLEPYGSFAILVDCRRFDHNLNRTLGLCEGYSANQTVDENSDPNFQCQFLNPVQLKIRSKGHTLMKNHAQEYINGGNLFNADYLAEIIKKNVPDFVTYIEDEYDLGEFLRLNSEFKADRKPKLLYFEENLLAPQFIRKLTSMLEGRVDVGLTDDLSLAKDPTSSYDDIFLYEYNYASKAYDIRKITYDIDSPIETLLQDPTLNEYKTIKKNRDILLDFEHLQATANNFSSLKQIYNLQSHARIIILQVSTSNDSYSCGDIQLISKKYSTLFNYVCFSRKEAHLLQQGDIDGNFLFIVDTVENGTWVKRDPQSVLKALPQAISRQRVSADTEAEHCLRTAALTNRDPIFFYFSEKAGDEKTYIINYLNSLPEVTSLLYFCQIYLPEQGLIKKFTLKQDTIFTMADTDGKGTMRKMEHSRLSTFNEIKMFLREIAIQKMLSIYEEKLINNKIVEIKNSEQLTEECFNKKCIIGLIATGRYREKEEIEMLKETKLEFEEQFKFVWIDGICHWDIPKQLKILKKKEKTIDRSYVFLYDEKDTSFSQWTSKKFWDQKDLKRWVKSLRNSRTIGHLKFALDMENKVCKAKEAIAKKPAEQL